MATKNGSTATVEKEEVLAKAIELAPLVQKTHLIDIVGLTPLILNRWSEKAKAQMSGKQQGKAQTKKPPKDPEADYQAARYLLPDGRDGMPSGAFKAAKNSPLHPHFEWDNKTAAHQYRLDQARELIRLRSVDIERPDGGTTRVNAWINLDPGPDGKRGYMPISDALSDPVRRQIVLDRARQDLNSWVNRYRHLEEAASLLSAFAEKLPAA